MNFFGPIRWRRRAALVCFFALCASLTLEASERKGWSIDLRQYGYREWRDSHSLFEASGSHLAVANNVVAVALGNPSSTRSDAYGTNWEVSLLLFDAATGRLNARRGPWATSHFFELFSAAHGNFLVVLRHAAAEAETGETLLLLSPSGDEIRRIELAPSVVASGRNTWNRVLVSSSGRTILVAQTTKAGIDYQVLDGDTLATKSEWEVEAGSHSPSIIALSDKELLGLAPRQSKAPNQTRDVLARRLDGPWNAFPAALDPRQSAIPMDFDSHQFAFLSDDIVVGVSTKPENRDASLQVLRSDGSSVFSPVIPRLEANTSLAGPVSATQDGRYFAVGFHHLPWISHLLLDVWKLDDTPASIEAELVIWRSGAPESIAKFNVGSEVDVRSFSLAIDDPPELVLLGRSTLKALLLPSGNR